MGDDLKNFGGIATGLSRSPLGIIALFIVLVYGLAALVLMVGRGMTAEDRTPLIWFLVAFPVLVLAVFTYLVACKQDKLIWPTDFKDERNYLEYTRALEAATSLAAASSKSGDREKPTEVQTIVAAVQSVTSSGKKRRSRGHAEPQLLWVDDRPSNNTFERRAFEAVGFHVTIATSTGQALDIVSGQRFDAIISDMARPESPKAGIELLEQLRAIRVSAPFFIYTGSESSERRREVLAQGGQGYTADPQTLFQLVTGSVLEAS